MQRFFTIFFIAVTTFTKAQSFIVSPDDTLVIVTNFNQFGIYDIYQENVSNDTIDLAWTPVLTDIPAGWDYSMCDLGHCYTGIPGGNMYPLPPSEMAFLGLNINPMNVSGIATIRVYVYDINFPSQGDTVTWIVKTADLVGTDEIEAGKISVYPNPANDFIVIETSDNHTNASVYITDLNGKIVLYQSSLTNIVRFDVSSLPPGIYAVRIILDDKMLTKKFIRN